MSEYLRLRQIEQQARKVFKPHDIHGEFELYKIMCREGQYIRKDFYEREERMHRVRTARRQMEKVKFIATLYPDKVAICYERGVMIGVAAERES